MIETANAVLPDQCPELSDASAMAVPPGEYAALSVTDTGMGMTPDVLARAFDPFFTTKPPATAPACPWSMASCSSRAGMYACAAPGQGTAVTIYLPRHLGAIHDEVDLALAVVPFQARVSAAVLVVEDEPVVRAVILDVLSGIGHTVLEDIATP